MSEYILEMNNISKEFPGVKALIKREFQSEKRRDSLFGRRKWCR